MPDDAPGVRPAEDPRPRRLQLEQEPRHDAGTDSGTDRTADDIEATADAPVGGQGPEEAAVHVTDG